MKNKLLVLNFLLGVFAIGCSESAYTPNPANLAANTAMTNPYNGYPNNNMFPNNNYQPLMNQQNMQMFPMYQQYQQRNMLTWGMRINTPGFYNYQYAYRSCIPRPYYVTTCTQRKVRRICDYNYAVRPATPTTPTDTANTTPPVAVDATANTANTTTPTQAVVTPAENETKVLPIHWYGKDAKALYERLAREEEVVEKDRLLNKGSRARTGSNYKCVMDKKLVKSNTYVCDLEIRMKDGILLEQENPGKIAAPETAVSMFKGDLVNIGLPGSTPETGMVIVAGQSAIDLFAELPTEEKEGKVEEVNLARAKIKMLGQVKCYKTMDIASVTECIIKIQSDTGAALEAVM